MKKYLLVLFIIVPIFFSCVMDPDLDGNDTGTGTGSSGTGTTDTTPPTIDSVSVSPLTVVEDHIFTLTVEATDAESDVTISYDMDNDGVFDDTASGSYSEAGEKTIAIKAESSGGGTVQYYTLTVDAIFLDLGVTYTAVSNTVNSAFSINYRITNYSNVPVTISSGLYTMYGSLGLAITDIIETNDSFSVGTLLSGYYVDFNFSGYSLSSTLSYTFALGFSYHDGCGNSNSEVFNGVFTFI